MNLSNDLTDLLNILQTKPQQTPRMLERGSLIKMVFPLSTPSIEALPAIGERTIASVNFDHTSTP